MVEGRVFPKRVERQGKILERDEGQEQEVHFTLPLKFFFSFFLVFFFSFFFLCFFYISLASARDAGRHVGRYRVLFLER